jgi:hypothetical protein
MNEKLLKKIQDRNEEITPSLGTIPFGGCLIIAALLEQSNANDLITITPLCLSERKLCPGNLSTSDHFGYISHCLLYDIDSTPHAFIDGEGDDFSYHYLQAQYKLRMTEHYDEFPKQLIIEMLKKEIIEDDFVGFCESTYTIENLFIEECLNFYLQETHVMGFKTEPTPKLKEIFKKMIEYTPLTQIFYIIAKAVKDTLAYQKKEGINIAHARNMLPGNIERYYNKIKLNNWKTMNYKRYKFEKASWMTYVLFDLVLELPGDGINYSLNDLKSIILNKKD